MSGEDYDMEDAPRGRSGVVKKQKGRGFREGKEQTNERQGGKYDSLAPAGGSGPVKSVEGWVLFVSGLHEETGEEDLHEAFAEHGDVKNIYLNLDRRTGYVKGYALIEYASKNEAQGAIEALNGQPLLTKDINVTWAFTQSKKGGGARGRR